MCVRAVHCLQVNLVGLLCFVASQGIVPQLYNARRFELDMTQLLGLVGGVAMFCTPILDMVCWSCPSLILDLDFSMDWSWKHRDPFTSWEIDGNAHDESSFLAVLNSPCL